MLRICSLAFLTAALLPAILNGSERHSAVLIHTTSIADVRTLVRGGLLVEHFTGSAARGIEMVLDESEIALLRGTGIPFDILVDDLREAYRARPGLTPADLARSRSVLSNDNIRGIELGSMGGFYTLAEMIAELDSMLLLYPAIITARTSLGLSHEGREIWMVKISDNPNENESDTEPVVYYDAVHHAREPGSMMNTLYYMYWLLENYGVDPRATYLVDNRELYFVPLVNPDGYAYNEFTDPDGGGFWRKNRRVNGGNCFGVDLNRNYSFGYGHDSGSSSDPCSGTYRGPSAFSEPEAQAIEGLLSEISPVIAFASHTYGEKFLNPYGYIEEAPSYEVYSEFSSDFVAGSSHLYGITAEMLGYFSSGTTRDYLHSEGTYAWTPEFGALGFWPPESTIFPTASENLHRFEYIAWVAGAFADLKNVRFGGFAGAGDTISFTVGIKNRGLTTASEGVAVSVSSEYDGITAIETYAEYATIAPRSVLHNDSEPFLFLLPDSAGFLDQVPFVLTVSQEGVVTSVDTVLFTVGTGIVLVGDDAESGPGLWTSSGNGQSWDTTFTDSYDGVRSFADSRYGNSDNSTVNYFTLADPIDLTATTHPVAEFAAKWSIEQGLDYARAQVSTNGGVTWWNLSGRHTTQVAGQPSYTGTRHWVTEELDISDFNGSVVDFRFHYQTDGGVPGDGFYFDNFAVIDYQGGGVSSAAEEDPLVAGTSLFQNYPNPFNPDTRISFQLAFQGEVSIKVYDLLGREIRTLVSADLKSGSHSVVWDGTDSRGNAVTSGIYFYRITASGLVTTRSMTLIR